MLIVWSNQTLTVPTYGIEWDTGGGSPVPPGGAVPPMRLILGEYGAGMTLKLGGN